MPSLPARTTSTARPAIDVTYTLITDRTAFDALEPEWNALFERSGRPVQIFQSFNWNWHWANHYLAASPGGISGLHLSIVVARRGGQLIAVWPLVSERQHGITQIFWMGDPVTQYGDVVVDNIPDALAVMRSGWDYLIAKIGRAHV
jgi:CelD/BcsL family acetyltransferase involved in cellulose biosynthesis